MESVSDPIEKPEPKLSKSQLKKQLKQQKWLEKRADKPKKKYHKSKSSAAHIMRFNSDPASDQPKLNKQAKLKLFKELCEQGPKYVIDCDFEEFQGDRELKSLGQQLAYCHSINKRLQQPINLFLTGVGDRLNTILTH